jgi:phosphoribosylaminoimidazolecarboxamide formyltransferase/IMP cyclohydrolase
MFNNALISVSDKTGLIEFLKPIKNLRILSTGGTSKYLRENGFTVIDVSEQTGFPEIMDGRVKTLHPKVHMGLLARSWVKEDAAILEQFQVQAFDLMICNLYPFEQSYHAGLEGQELIEKIDIGGPSMLRSAAKSFERLAVVCDPKDYSWIQGKNYHLNIDDRKLLAAKVFSQTATYDQLISHALRPKDTSFEKEALAFANVQELRYGENPQQKAQWVKSLAAKSGWHQSEVLQGKPLSYNNLLDLEAAANLVRQFQEPACVAVKHNNPCGVAIDADADRAVAKALKADPVSVFGGIVAINKKVSAQMANDLGQIFLECIVAPDFSDEALQIFQSKKNLRILKWKNMLSIEEQSDLRSIAGGYLIQQQDLRFTPSSEWQIYGETPSAEITRDLLFAEKISASLKSNSIAIVENGASLGLGMGQVNRVEAVEHAIHRMHQHGKNIKNPILASDAFFPFADSIERIAKAGIKWVLQPGGSVKDKEVLQAAQKLNVNIVITGVRHFRH